MFRLSARGLMRLSVIATLAIECLVDRSTKGIKSLPGFAPSEKEIFEFSEQK